MSGLVQKRDLAVQRVASAAAALTRLSDDAACEAYAPLQENSSIALRVASVCPRACTVTHELVKEVEVCKSVWDLCSSPPRAASRWQKRRCRLWAESGLKRRRSGRRWTR